MDFWKNKKVVVTGRAGFLDSQVVKKLYERGCKEIFVPRIEEYDLRQETAIIRMYETARLDIVIHPSTTLPSAALRFRSGQGSGQAGQAFAHHK